MTDEAIIDEEVLLCSALQRRRGCAYEASYRAEGTLVAHGDERLGELLPPDADDTLLERTGRERLVILPCTTEGEGDLRIGQSYLGELSPDLHQFRRFLPCLEVLASAWGVVEDILCLEGRPYGTGHR